VQRLRNDGVFNLFRHNRNPFVGQARMGGGGVSSTLGNCHSKLLDPTPLAQLSTIPQRGNDWLNSFEPRVIFG
jgi:hypothetical protein